MPLLTGWPALAIVAGCDSPMAPVATGAIEVTSSPAGIRLQVWYSQPLGHRSSPNPGNSRLSSPPQNWRPGPLGRILFDPSSSGTTRLSDPIARLNAAIGRRYTIERELGRGGMGTVYLAVDRKHGRKVAIKVLPPDVAAALGPERFLREIRIAAQLSHPHILPLHDSGQAAGLLYYVMPYVQGESLRSRLAREGRLPVADAVEIARQMADALSSAHANGVIHRDVKPENILLAGYPPSELGGTGWHSLLADFGVAKAFGMTHSASHGRSDEAHTDSGLPLGTAAYASPEQAAGSRVLDGRSDIYSLGCVLYEMLVGVQPGGGPTASEILEKRFAVPPPPARKSRAEVPEWIDGVLARALALNPAERFPTAAEFRDRLAFPPPIRPESAAAVTPGRYPRLLWMGAGAAMLTIIVAAVAFGPRYAANPDPKQVVVAGFDNKTGDSAMAPIGDIAADYIARGLASTRLLHQVYDARAAARESGKPARADPAAGRELGKKVGAGTVLWGSYYRDGDSLHFEATLLDAASGRVILSLEPAVGPLESPTRVVEILRQRVMGAFAAVFQAPRFESWEAQSIPPTYDAYREVLAGSEAVWNFDYERAIHHSRRALAFDSSYVGAKVELAVALGEHGDCSEVDSIARSLELTRDRLAPVDRGRLNWATARCRGDFAAALDASRAVIEATPGSVGSRLLGSIMAIELFRPREALELLQPLDSRIDELTSTRRGMYRGFRQIAYHMLGDYRAELAEARTDIRPEEPGGGGGAALAALGRVAEARQEVEKLLQQNDTQGAQCVALELRAHGHAHDGQAMLEKVVGWYRAHPNEDPATANDNPCLWIQLSALYDAGLWSEAREDYERLAASDTTNVNARAGLGALAARQGDRVEVARIERWLSDRPWTHGRAMYARARMAALLGNREQAVARLRDAFDLGLGSRQSIHIDPDFESLRDYPPYQELMRIKG
jgi:serine/threonine protein kinase/tetratricopeptide (TPR) repeat protein